MNLLVAVIPAVLLVLAAKRFPRYRLQPESRPLTNLLAAFGASKLLRIPVITDEHIDPTLERITGVANLTDFGGMVLAALACVSMVGLGAYITGREARSIGRIASGFAIAMAMVTTFMLAPVSKTPTSYMTRNFAPTGAMLAYWIVFVTAIACSATMLFAYTSRAWLLVRQGPFGRVLFSVSAAAAVGVLYCVHKIIDLALTGAGATGWYAKHAQSIGMVLVLLPLAFAGYAAWVYLAAGFPDRVNRFRTLRSMLDEWRHVSDSTHQVILEHSLIPDPSRWTIWKASANSLATHRMMVELADAAGDAEYKVRAT
jgi:hypothetical protein